MKIGSVNGLLEGDRSKVRFVQTNMGRVILAAQIARTGADFGVMSGGGIRDSIEAGDITYKSVLKVQPFGNIVVYADMERQEVVDYLTAVAQMKPGLRRLSTVRQCELCRQRGQAHRSENQRRAC
ncbi:bifunctional UDP-sugar hydrolase/5'-nucleotidase periplasmic precursor [Salmonella enterica subsp. enterica]|uniref:Bifunctional UDP-sugar hydrolase/5'-nucleotidase periplasmic n=1 Tax=Salmonella enterica I TaxID=59201 RepID=A0A379WYX9_SALET|nr:bifunctional UDP-sugar hydrolase/5'-nucleotidase periplasmic precursor [Salmonella enterica subsp. enterica]